MRKTAINFLFSVMIVSSILSLSSCQNGSLNLTLSDSQRIAAVIDSINGLKRKPQVTIPIIYEKDSVLINNNTEVENCISSYPKGNTKKITFLASDLKAFTDLYTGDNDSIAIHFGTFTESFLTAMEIQNNLPPSYLKNKQFNPKFIGKNTCFLGKTDGNGNHLSTAPYFDLGTLDPTP